MHGDDHEDGPTRPEPSAPAASDEREAILSRRRKFVVSALSGLSLATAGACESRPMTCLSPPPLTTPTTPPSVSPPPPTTPALTSSSTAPASAPDAGAPPPPDAGPTPPDAGPAPTPNPRPTVCLKVAMPPDKNGAR